MAAVFKASLASLLALSICAVLLGAGSATAGASPAHAARLPGIPASAHELTGLRTRTSRTFATPSGSRIALISAGAVNYRDASGRWQPIDNTLVAATGPAYAYTNAANAYRLELPASLDRAPVKIDGRSSWIDFGLRGASGSATAAGATATYRDALRDTDVLYTAGGSAVKEALTLKSAAAPAVFRYELGLSSDLRPQQNASGGIDFLNASGGRVFAFAPPYMYDRSGAISRDVALRLGRGAHGYTLALVPSRRWLESSTRAWPVTIDPSTSIYPDYDCYVVSSAPDTSECGGTNLQVGYDGSARYRSLIKFNTSTTVPATAVVLNAELGLYAESKTTSNAFTVGAYQVSSDWTTAATWNDADVDSFSGTSTPWATPGGDFASTPAATVNVGTSTGAFQLYPTQLVQDWVDGAAPNDGFLLKQTTESTNNVLTLASMWASDTSTNPYLAVTYEYGQGAWNGYTQAASQQLDDHLGLSVNAATGDLMAKVHDFSVVSVGPTLSFDRYYNSLGAQGGDQNGGGELDWKWQIGTGVDTYLESFGDGSVALHDGSGYALPFLRSGGAFVSPRAADLQLTKNADGSYTLAHGDGSKDNFSVSGLLTSRVDAAGNAITFTYAPTPSTICCPGPWELTKITTPGGGATTFAYDAGGLLTSVKDPAGRLYRYGYDGWGDLASSTDPSGAVTRYSYDYTGALTQIRTPNGNVAKIAYDFDNRVTSITRTTTTSTTGPTTTFTYNDAAAGAEPPYNTVVTAPDGRTTTYYYDAESRVYSIVTA